GADGRPEPAPGPLWHAGRGRRSRGAGGSGAPRAPGGGTRTRARGRRAVGARRRRGRRSGARAAARPGPRRGRRSRAGAGDPPRGLSRRPRRRAGVRRHRRGAAAHDDEPAGPVHWPVAPLQLHDAMRTDKVLHAPPDLDPFARELPRLDAALSSRIDADPERVERGLAQLVLTIVELLRQLMERQALRRVESGTLDEDQIERLGRTLMLLERRMEELTEEFGLTAEDLNLNLGPLGDLL